MASDHTKTITFGMQEILPLLFFSVAATVTPANAGWLQSSGLGEPRSNPLITDNGPRLTVRR